MEYLDCKEAGSKDQIMKFFLNNYKTIIVKKRFNDFLNKKFIDLAYIYCKNIIILV